MNDWLLGDLWWLLDLESEQGTDGGCFHDWKLLEIKDGVV
jgi:hypothetical protein